MIRRLQVRNFKSLRDLDLPLGPLNVLVGPNMAGKSNILDVFVFLHNVFFPEAGTQGIAYALAQRGGVSEVVWKGGDEKLISFVLEGDHDVPDTRYEYMLQLIAGAGNSVTVQNESLKLVRPVGPVDLIRQEGGSLRIVNADGTDFGVSPPGVSALQYPMPNWDGYKFHEWVRLWRFYHLIPPVMKRPSPMGLGQVLMKNGENLSAWLMWLQTNSPEAFGRINEVLRDLFPDISQVKTTPTPDGSVHLAVQEKGLKRPTTVWQASDGLVVLAALLSLIYVPPELSGTLFCIEEPENHLHPRLLETLVALLRQVRQEVLDSKVPLAQVIITTQSPYLLDQMSVDEVIWIDKQEGKTRAIRPGDKGHIRSLVQNKELGLGDIVYSGILAEER